MVRDLRQSLECWKDNGRPIGYAPGLFRLALAKAVTSPEAIDAEVLHFVDHTRELVAGEAKVPNARSALVELLVLRAEKTAPADETVVGEIDQRVTWWLGELERQNRKPSLDTRQSFFACIGLVEGLAYLAGRATCPSVRRQHASRAAELIETTVPAILPQRDADRLEELRKKVDGILHTREEEEVTNDA